MYLGSIQTGVFRLYKFVTEANALDPKCRITCSQRKSFLASATHVLSSANAKDSFFYINTSVN